MNKNTKEITKYIMFMYIGVIIAFIDYCIAGSLALSDILYSIVAAVFLIAVLNIKG